MNSKGSPCTDRAAITALMTTPVAASIPVETSSAFPSSGMPLMTSVVMSQQSHTKKASVLAPDMNITKGEHPRALRKPFAGSGVSGRMSQRQK